MSWKHTVDLGVFPVVPPWVCVKFVRHFKGKGEINFGGNQEWGKSCGGRQFWSGF